MVVVMLLSKCKVIACYSCTSLRTMPHSTKPSGSPPQTRVDA